MRGSLNVLVTGGCGFIGCHSVRRWAESHRVLALDNLSRRGSEANLAWLRQSCRFDFLQRDIRDAAAMADAVRDFRPDVVLLDIGLPGLSGYDVAREIRSRPEGVAIILAAVTGYGQEEDRRRARDAGFDYHLTKPIDPDTLSAFVDSPGPSVLART